MLLCMARKSKGFLRRKLAKSLKRMRGEISQNQFCKKLGVDHSTLNRLENREQNVTIDTLEKFCINLDCDLSDLFDVSE